MWYGRGVRFDQLRGRPLGIETPGKIVAWDVEMHRLREWIQVFWLPTYTGKQLNLIENVGTHRQRIYFRRMLT